MVGNTFKITNILFFVIFITCYKNTSSKNLENFGENQKFSNDHVKYKYSSAISFGGLFTTSEGLFSYTDTEKNNAFLNQIQRQINTKSNLSSINKKNIFSIMGFNFSYNVLITSPFFAKNLGVFPRFGTNINIIGQNYLTRFWLYFFQNIGIGFYNASVKTLGFFSKNINKICCCFFKNGYELEINTKKFYKSYLSRPSGILNLTFTFEPEPDTFQAFRVIPQIGIGPSVVFLSRNCIADFFPNRESSSTFAKNNDKLLYPQILDIVFTSKMIFKFTSQKSFLNSFQLELGYTYNPLILSHILNPNDAAVQGGLWNLFVSLNYARNMNIGLETVDFLNPTVKSTIDKDKINKYFPINHKTKNTMLIDCGIGCGSWTDIKTNGDISRILSPSIFFSFSMPYFIRLSNNHYLSFIGIDLNEDLYTGKYHNKNHNFIWNIINNLSVNYNFLTLTSDYNGVKFMHKLGIFIPFITHLMSFVEFPLKMCAFNREMVGIEDKNVFKNANNNITNAFHSRISYRFKVFVDIFRLAGYSYKQNIFFNIGINTTLFNKRPDFARFSSKDNFDIYLIKLESITLGISFKFNS